MGMKPFLNTHTHKHTYLFTYLSKQCVAKITKSDVSYKNTEPKDVKTGCFKNKISLTALIQNTLVRFVSRI